MPGAAAVRAERIGRLEAFLGEPGSARFAFGAARGVRPGAEGLAVLVAPIVAFLLPDWGLLASALIGAAAGGLGAFAVISSRVRVTIGLTDDEVMVVRHGRSRRSRLESSEWRRARGDVALVASGDTAVMIGCDRYWVAGWDADEARSSLLAFPME